MNANAKPIEQQRADYYRRISTNHLTPLWEVLHTIVPREPSPRCVPVLWRYEEIRGPLMEAGELISAQEATRRVLILENPAFRGESRVTNTLYAGLQLLKPGECAPAHRHTQSALRFVLEGKGAFTSVEGERYFMSVGDLVLTPAWTWHDHGSEGGEPTIWLDGLDIPLVQMLDAGFAENMTTQQQIVTRPEGDAIARFGTNLLPVDYQPTSLTSPVFAYPYQRTREALYAMSRGSDPHPNHGYKMRYINPTTGGHVVPTMAAFMQLLPAGFASKRYRSTDATIIVVVEGSGRSTVGETSYRWGKRDIFVIPSWYPCQHEALEEAVLFSFSDRVVQERLGLWREASD
jgi:gentisate 1,2-dioxygenase